MRSSGALLLALSAASVASAGFVKVDIDDGRRYPQGPLPEQAAAAVSRRDDGGKGKGKGFIKLDFETEQVGRRLKPRQLDEDDLDHNITLATQRSVCTFLFLSCGGKTC